MYLAETAELIGTGFLESFWTCDFLKLLISLSSLGIKLHFMACLFPLLQWAVLPVVCLLWQMSVVSCYSSIISIVTVWLLRLHRLLILGLTWTSTQAAPPRLCQISHHYSPGHRTAPRVGSSGVPAHSVVFDFTSGLVLMFLKCHQWLCIVQDSIKPFSCSRN